MAALRALVCTTIAAAALIVAPAFAQNLTGEIDGVTRDTQGAAVAHATVTVRNAEQNVVVRTVTTNGHGIFVIPALATGTYSITVDAPGFKATTQNNIPVDVSTQRHVDIVLPVGNVSEEVTVSESTIQPDTQSSAAGTLLTGEQVRSLSLSSRNYQQLLSLQPGVSGDPPGAIERGNVVSTGKTNAATFSVNGQQDQQNSYFLDGEDLLNHGGSYQTATFPNIDAIQEMNLLRNSYGAQYGGGGSAVVAMQTRSGGSVYHGGVWEFYRSQVLNANDPLSKLAANGRPGIRYNDFGFNVSGPVWIPHLFSREHPKTFFFVLQSFLRQETQSTASQTNVPTAAERQGIFPAPICIGYTGTKCTTSSTTVKTIDATAQAYLTDILDKVPLPNDPRNNQNLIASQRGFNNETQTVIRIDRQFGQRVTAFFRMLNDPFNLVVPYGLYGSSGLPGVKTAAVTDGGTDWLGHLTWTVTPKTVIDGGYAQSPLYITAEPNGYEAKANAPHVSPNLTYPSFVDRVPNLTVSGTAYTGGTGGFYDNRGDNVQIFANVTHTAGRHTIYAGENIEFESSGNNTQTNNAGTFTFTGGSRPTGSAATAWMQSFAQFLMGNVTQFTQLSANATFMVHTHLYETYVQDDFRATRRLVLNGGIRYSIIKQPTVGPFHGETYPLVNFDPHLYSATAAPTIDNTGAICTKSCAGGKSPNPNYNPTNGLIISSQSSPFGDAVSSQHWTNVAPRFGFALDVFGNGSTALRGGAGLYFIQPFMNYTETLPSNQPNLLQTTNANVTFANPGAQTLSSQPNSVSANQVDWKQSYAETWSLDVQRALLRDSLLDVGYYGNRVVHLTGTEDLNEVPPGTYVAAGVIPAVAGSTPPLYTITSSNQANLNQIRPFLGYGPINTQTTNFSSNYNSLQSSFRKNWSGSGSVLVNYTWSKALSNTRENYQSAPQSPYNLAQEYGPTNQNRKHIFSSAFIYNIPAFRRQRGLTGKALGGWEVTGIVSAAAGRPFSAATTGVDPGGLGLLNSASASVSYPDVVTNPNKSAPRTSTSWFNPNAFVQVPAYAYRPGNEQANDIVGPGYQTWDLSAIKNFNLPREGNLQIRGEAFNTFNHTNPTTVNATVGNASYDQITAYGAKRVLQLAAKLTF
jgi:hypothetical protein